jgi:antirestriction protein ArdC
MNKTELFNQINNSIIKHLASGTLIWRQTWERGLPTNFISKKVYGGINFLLLCNERVNSPYYLTFNQAKQKQLHIRKNSKGRTIIFYKILTSEIKVNGKTISQFVPLLRFSSVFNLDDIENFTPPNPTLKNPLKMLDEISIKHTPVIVPNYTSCYYSEKEDLISTPTVDKFDTEEEFFCSIFHELIHWSGHPSRLNRAKAGKFRIESYAFEELVAELGATYLLGICGITNTLDNSSSYISDWLSVAKGDNSFIISASIQAQKAVNYLLGLNHNK